MNDELLFNSYRASVWDDEKVLEAISGESESQPIMSDYIVHGILQARILERVVIPFYRESSPGIEPRSSTLHADSLPAESPGKPKLVAMVVKQHEWTTLEVQWLRLHASLVEELRSFMPCSPKKRKEKIQHE